MKDTGKQPTRETRSGEKRKTEQRTTGEGRMFAWFGLGLAFVIFMLVVIAVSLG